MKLLEKQQAFVCLVTALLGECFKRGYGVTLGEAWRPQITALAYAKKGLGIKNSLHCDRLAIDLNFFKDGKYLTKTEEYQEMGLYWESLSHGEIECCWGGKFGDGNHFSVADAGRK
jgi:hypothetical protein